MTLALQMVENEYVPVDLVLWGVLGVTIIIFGLYSAVLLWHWKEYSTGKFTTVANMFMYLGVSGCLLALMALSAAGYSLL
jgi:hypothetical protein